MISPEAIMERFEQISDEDLKIPATLGASNPGLTFLQVFFIR
jgi:hypothetical protein